MKLNKEIILKCSNRIKEISQANNANTINYWCHFICNECKDIKRYHL